MIYCAAALSRDTANPSVKVGSQNRKVIMSKKRCVLPCVCSLLDADPPKLQ